MRPMQARPKAIAVSWSLEEARVDKVARPAKPLESQMWSIGQSSGFPAFSQTCLVEWEP